MSETTPPTPPAPDDELLARLTALQTKSETYKVEIEALQKEIAELVDLPEEGPVTAAFDDRGSLVSLVIDREAAAELEPQQLITEINYALARASQHQAPFGGSDPAGALGDVDVSGFLEHLLASATSGVSSEPQVHQNDLRTVTVTTIAGSLVAIDCSEPFIRSTGVTSIAEEIIRVTAQALEQDDPLGRRTREDS